MTETITRAEADEDTKTLVLELRDVIRVEEAWAIAQKALHAAYTRGVRDTLDEM